MVKEIVYHGNSSFVTMMSNDDIRLQSVKKNTIIVHEDDNLCVIAPLNLNSFIYHSKKTKWLQHTSNIIHATPLLCIHPFFIILDKKNDERYCLMKVCNFFIDSNGENVNREYVSKELEPLMYYMDLYDTERLDGTTRRRRSGDIELPFPEDVPEEKQYDDYKRILSNPNFKYSYGNLSYMVPDKLQTLDFFWPILEMNLNAFYYISEDIMNEDVCKFVCSKNGNYLEYVPEKFKTHNVCFQAIKNTPAALQFLPSYILDKPIGIYKQIFLKASQQNGAKIEYFPDAILECPEIGKKICFNIIEKNGFEISNLPTHFFQNDDLIKQICFLAISNTPEALNNVVSLFKEFPEWFCDLCDAVIELDSYSYKYVPKQFIHRYPELSITRRLNDAFKRNDCNHYDEQIESMKKIFASTKKV